MNEPEERSSRTEVPTEERVGERVERDERDERDKQQRAAPIDEDVVGELNAALPEEQPTDREEDAHG